MRQLGLHSALQDQVFVGRGRLQSYVGAIGRHAQVHEAAPACGPRRAQTMSATEKAANTVGGDTPKSRAMASMADR